MTERLERYRQMRDFRITPEPRGNKRSPKLGPKESELRYYIQRHDASRLHYDFRLELEGVLKSWAVPKGPSLDPGVRRLAVQTEDHPLEYGEFEGVIPEKQYGAGDVLLWDKGRWIPEDADSVGALRKGRLHFRLEGAKLRGSWILTRTRSESGKAQWLLIKRNDDEARTGEDADITRIAPESVKRPPKASSRAKRSELPQFIAPQLATLVSEPPAGDDWVYEVKHDGYRMLARIEKSSVRLFTRSGKDWTSKLTALARELKKLKLDGSWLDGEIVVQGPGGRSSFQKLQNSFDAGRDSDIVYYVFDAPFLKGQDLRQLPLRRRKQRLKSTLSPSAVVRFSEDLVGDGKPVLEHACKLGLEGLIGKHADSVYISGRSRSWIKLKCRQRQDFVIVGYSAPGGSRQGFGALLVGYYDALRKLRYAGKVGTGFDDDLLKSLTRRLAALKRPDPPVQNPPKEKNVTWVRPVLVAEVAFAERTDEGILRQASFMGLREDIPPKSVGEEKPQSLSNKPSLNIKITHPERLVWPTLGITKADLVRYCEAVGEWMLPHVAKRPLTLVRCPDGAEAKCFYQRHLGMGASPGEVKTFKRARSSKGYYIYIDSLAGILSAVQNGAVEFHTWGATLPDVRRPDRITLDLDPDEDLPWARLVDATRLTRTLVDSLGLKNFLKTTGGKGLHVVIPIQPALEWDEVKEFSRLMAEFLVRAEPGLFTAKIAKNMRGGKVFVDYLRNSQTASAVAAYSARARAGAGVSTPLDWDELKKEDLRGRFNLRSVPKRVARLKEDPWKDYFAAKQSITAAMRRALAA
jgi:bifunctional non-homologous end joining protein LigD